jgi:hypothetical protein
MRNCFICFFFYLADFLDSYQVFTDEAGRLLGSRILAIMAGLNHRSATTPRLQQQRWILQRPQQHQLLPNVNSLSPARCHQPQREHLSGWA